MSDLVPSHSDSLLDFLSGVFPQDEYPEEVSTDEDDDMFGSRKRMKRRGGRMEEEEEGAPASKKSKGTSCWHVHHNTLIVALDCS